MFHLGTNIIGVGSKGAAAAEYAMKNGIDGAGYACVMADGAAGFDVCCDGRGDFVANCDRLFVNKNGVAFVTGDFSDRVVASLVCEICAVSRAMGSLTVAVVYMPYTGAPAYAEAEEYVDELHEVADGVVIVNSGYAPDFADEVYTLLRMLSDGMNPDGAKHISSRDELEEIFATERNIYFAAVSGNTGMDSHGYYSQTMSMRLDSQIHIDIAANFAYFATCGASFPKEVLAQYVNAVDKKNIAYMPVKKAYIFENNPGLSDGEFLFGVLCSQ